VRLKRRSSGADRDYKGAPTERVKVGRWPPIRVALTARAAGALGSVAILDLEPLFDGHPGTAEVAATLGDDLFSSLARWISRWLQKDYAMIRIGAA